MPKRRNPSRRDRRGAVAPSQRSQSTLSASESEGEDLIENADRDYRAIPELDQYNAAELDDRDYGRMSASTRQAAERELEERDQHQSVGLVPLALREGGELEGEAESPFPQQRIESLVDQYEDELDVAFNLENFSCSVKDWIVQPQTRREIKRRFKSFLHTYVEEGQHESVYFKSIQQMCSKNLRSLEVNYRHLSTVQPILGIWLADHPREVLPLFNEVAKEVVCTQYPRYSEIHPTISVRIVSIPLEDKLRELRQLHMNCLVMVRGVVTKRTGVYPKLLNVLLKCNRCGTMQGPYQIGDEDVLKVKNCSQCQSNGNFSVDQTETVYRNYQRITIQESPSSIEPGRVPRHKDVILLDDLIDVVRPGEEVTITGIYSTMRDIAGNVQMGFPVFRTFIEANQVQRRDDLLNSNSLTLEDEQEILSLSRDPQIEQKLIDSIAPSIYGHRDVKLALLTSLFSGQEKHIDQHRIRGDINVLLLGDPGTAKSQFLKYAERISPRAIFTNGKGASAVGLTASVRKDTVTKEWSLEGGALVLADQGVCLIDEFDKMNEMDRVSIHEAMEQQSISISKAGIVTTLQARCGVIAAANPLGGRYDVSKTLSDNINLTDPILQRFDILLVLQDKVDPILDEAMATFIIDSHILSHPMSSGAEAVSGAPQSVESSSSSARTTSSPDQSAPISPTLLKKYILYSRLKCFPSLTGIDVSRVEELYVNLRKASIASGGLPIAVRHVESIMRISEAHARMHLRDHVTDADLNVAISILLESFISSQKFNVMKSMRKQFQHFITEPENYFTLLLYLLSTLMQEMLSYRHIQWNGAKDDEDIAIPLSDLEKRARDVSVGMVTVREFLESAPFRNEEYSFEAREKMIYHKP